MYSIDERAVLTRAINETLKSDDDDVLPKSQSTVQFIQDFLPANLIPINPDNEDIFRAVEDGKVLSKLINLVIDGSVDLRALNNITEYDAYKITENLNLALNAGKGIGLRIPNITP